jgi:hypothetical protein
VCQGHSHLQAGFLGEETSGTVPVLTFALTRRDLTIQTTGQAGTKLILPTTGLLFLPSSVLEGSFLSTPPPKVAPSMSLCLMPVSDGTIMSRLLAACYSWPKPSSDDPPSLITSYQSQGSTNRLDDVPW